MTDHISKAIIERRARRKRAHLRGRKRVKGTPERLRLGVFRSNKHMYAQIINDVNGTVMLSVSTLSPAVRERVIGDVAREISVQTGKHPQNE